jgi:Kef-type K+ transport system membrane component KefB
MARALAVVLILAIVVVVQRFEPVGSAPAVALPIGFSLIAAYLLGGVVERFRLPRLSGYLLFGLVCGPYLLNLITAPMARELQLVNSLALALIALVAGLELNFRRLRSQLRVLATLGTVIIFGTIGLLTVMLWLAWPWLPFPELGGPGRVAAALITAALVASFSPTVTIAVIAELRSRGSLTDLIMALVVLADLALIFVFALAMQFARWAFASSGADVGIGVQLSWEIFGSLAFGGIVGAVFALYLRLVGRELTLVLLAVCTLLAIMAPVLHFELILAALAAGLVVENLAPPEGDDLRDAIERGALPVLVIFFAAAGASLQLDVLAVIGGVALALAAIRLALVRVTADVGVRLAGVADTPARHLWMGLVSQAGVTLGLATIAAAEFPGWGEDVRTLVVALTGLHVLTGPIFLKACLARAGEIGRGSPP